MKKNFICNYKEKENLKITRLIIFTYSPSSILSRFYEFIFQVLIITHSFVNNTIGCKLHNTIGQGLCKGMVMRSKEDGSFKIIHAIIKRGNRFKVQVVRGFLKNKQVGVL